MSHLPSQLRTKPLLRGVSHEIAAFVAAPAALALVAMARSATARTAALVYGASLFTLFLVSAFFHRPVWSARARRLIGRFDHSAIFLLIAGTYTPFCLLIGPGTGYGLLATVWTGAGLGMVLALAWADPPKKLMAGIYVLLGWCVVPAAPAARAAIGGGGLLLLFGGGLVYTVGAVIYAFRKPDPFPTVFGFHEIFHLLVVGAAACHFVAIEHVIRTMS